MTNSKQKCLLYKMTIFAYIAGLPYFWFEECRWPPLVINIIGKATTFVGIVNYGFFMMTSFLPFFTQKYLTEQHIYDMIMYNVSLPFFYMTTVNLSYYKDDVKQLIYELVVCSPSVYNDPKIEAEMLVKTRCLLKFAAINGWFGVAMIIVSSLIPTVTSDEVFSTIISAWPDLEDRSTIASAFRVMICIVYFFLVLRCNAAVLLMICLIVYANHQFKQLYSYFSSLTKIFDEDLNQFEKEKKYESALKIGIKMHSDILSYIQRLVKSCNFGYGGQIIINVSIIAVVMIRLTTQEKTLIDIITGAGVSVAVLTATGILMGILGDITLEADKLTTAIYMSGWENCTENSSVRVRKLLSISMAQTQKPLTIYALGIIAVSFTSFVSIVKFSYTIFSVIV